PPEEEGGHRGRPLRFDASSTLVWFLLTHLPDPDRGTDDVSAPPNASERGAFVEVAVPLPLPHALHYRLPDRFRSLAAPGSRVRVQVGKRRLVGGVVAVTDRAPDGLDLRDVDDLLDQRPVLTEELLRLGAFV